MGKLPGGVQGCRFFCAAVLGIILLFRMEIQAAEPGSFTYKSVEEQTEEPDTSLLNDLDFSDIQQTVDEILGGDFQFETAVLDLITGKQPFTIESFLEALIHQAGSNWETEKRILLSILVL